MSPKTLVVRTKLVPPRLHRRILPRQRLISLLVGAVDYRLTVLQAGPGYGKTTALAALQESGTRLAWYHLGAEDVDPLVFLLHLAHSLQVALPHYTSQLAGRLENELEEAFLLAWPAVVDTLANELVAVVQQPLLVILDDAHRLGDAQEALAILDRLVERAPADVHFILSSRYALRLPSLGTWRAHGEVLFIGQEALAFTTEEITALFRERYGLSLSDEQIAALGRETEGWPIALQLYSQGLKSGAISPAGRRSLPETERLESLFEYLAQEVFSRFSPEVREFLQATVVLRELSVPVCNELRGQSDSASHLRYLLENGLFVADLGGEMVRYHPLFREFILRRLPPADQRQLYEQAARCYQARAENEEAVYHYLKAENFSAAASILAECGEGLVRAGRLEILSKWIGALPLELLENRPQLMVYLGDVARLRSRFEEALGWYRHAEERSRVMGEMRGVSQALHGQARVYLDTVNPSQAEQLLQEALRIADGTDDRENRAHLLELLAENRLNSGRLEEAERFREQARSLREMGPAEVELSLRVLLRTGRLGEARRLLEQRMQEERLAPVLRPRAHRETLLLLSLILSMEGEGEGAFGLAVEGTQRGRILESPFITAVGMMRQGHAWLMRDTDRSYEEAVHCYQSAVEVAENLAVPRLKVEAMWGFCRAHGFRGELEEAEAAARQGLELGRLAGDEWISALILISMGGGYALCGRYPEASQWLDQARVRFNQVSDRFGETAARLWQCAVWWWSGDLGRVERNIDEVLRAVRENGYEFLFTRSSLIGPPDPHSLVPLLIFARPRSCLRPVIESLLDQLGIPGIEIHPGYQLRVQTLGHFRVWRGKEEVGVGEWRREKARQLFQVLLTFRRSPIERDRLLEMLWPGCDPETGARNLKVTMSTLLRVLEPGYHREDPPAYILRDGSYYSLRPNADLQLDSAQMERLVALGDSLPDGDEEEKLRSYRAALLLYQGEYLPDSLYEDWAGEERERLLDLFLRTSNLLAHRLAELRRWREVLEVGQSILTQDDCWEEAYRLMMQAHSELGNRAQALRLYQRCTDRLASELGTSPSPTTTHLAETLLKL